MLGSDTGLGIMYTRPARVLLSDTHLVIMLRSDSDFGLMYTRYARILTSHIYFAAFLLLIQITV